MRIFGFQKMTMLDYPQHIAATVFTGGCNFRCPFCHNAGLVTKISADDELTEYEILSYLEKRKGMLDGVCVTGGEPLLNVDIGVFIRRIKELGLKVKLDTNGSYPERLENLVSAELVDYVAMDIKNSEKKYASTVGITSDVMPQIKKSIDFLINRSAGYSCDYEFRTTLVKQYHNIEDIEAMAKMISGAKNYFLQCFKDSGNLVGEEKLEALDEAFVHLAQEKASLFVENVKIRGID